MSKVKWCLHAPVVNRTHSTEISNHLKQPNILGFPAPISAERQKSLMLCSYSITRKVKRNQLLFCFPFPMDRIYPSKLYSISVLKSQSIHNPVFSQRSHAAGLLVKLGVILIVSSKLLGKATPFSWQLDHRDRVDLLAKHLNEGGNHNQCNMQCFGSFEENICW